MRPVLQGLFARRKGGGGQRLATLAVALILLHTHGAGGHIRPLVGKLVDLVRQSDLVVIGVIARAALDPGNQTLEIAVEQTLIGRPQEHLRAAHCPARLAEGQRYVVFLAWDGHVWRCVQPAETRFPAPKEHDADYARAVHEIGDALRLPEDKQVPALRAVLIPTLRAAPMELRYHAALELLALTHPGHELTQEEIEALATVRAAPGLDPVLEPMLDRLVGTE